jgi:hypothetical protein
VIPLYLRARDPVVAEAEWRIAVGGKWKSGRSAHALAHTWFGATSFPSDVQRSFSRTEAFVGLEPLVGLVEHEVALRGRGPASHNDLLVIARKPAGGTVVVAVEAKVDEGFGTEDVEHWLAAGGANRAARLAFLTDVLALTDSTALGGVAYQLVHRTASALIEAGRFEAGDAVMLVHSFGDRRSSFDEYSRFAEAMGVAAPPEDAVVRARRLRGIDLWLGWVSSALPAVAM